jgi:hypothetical protein
MLENPPPMIFELEFSLDVERSLKVMRQTTFMQEYALFVGWRKASVGYADGRGYQSFELLERLKVGTQIG